MKLVGSKFGMISSLLWPSLLRTPYVVPFASRLASLQGFPGCFEGYVTDLARAWLDGLDEEGRRQVYVFACGPTPMLSATAALAREYALPCQVCLEEYMACAVGGCAGCAVRIDTPAGPAMKRVCVDGPVFDAYSVHWY